MPLIGALLIAITLARAHRHGALPPRQASATSPAPVRYFRHDLLFGSIDVPDVARRTQPDTFIARRGGATAEIIMEASTPHVDDRSVDCRRGQLIYKSNRPRVFAYSCNTGADVIYSVTKYGRTYLVGASDATEQIGYTIRYPASQKQYWDAVVAHMTRSLHFSP
jgi:hypothetical protein